MGCYTAISRNRWPNTRMANPVTRVTDYLAVLTRSQLLTPDAVAAAGRGWEGPDADVESFRRTLVAGRHLTEYQSVMVQRGHADGFLIGGYIVQDRIGKGQSAGVYLCKHPSGQLVALKVLPSSKARNGTALSRFLREGRLLTQLDHPNVVRAFQLGSTRGLHYIVMEHLVGETLDEVLARRKRLPAAEACRLTDQLLDGLDHLNDNRMIHRDVKPANLMVVPGRQVGKPDTTLESTIKLVDIGLGREFFGDDPADNPDSADLNLTREGAILGTPDYLAPEQARDARSADIRSDIYSAGCVLFHCLTGRPPFMEGTVMGQMIKHATEPAPRLAELAPNAPRALQLVLDRMMAKDPADRYQTPFEAAEALQLFLPEHNVSPNASAVLPGFKRFLISESKAPNENVITTPGPKRAGDQASGTKPMAKRPIQKVATPTAVTINDDFNFEIPTTPTAAPVPAPLVVPRPNPTSAMPDSTAETQNLPESRSPFALDRRDWIMLSAGFGLSFAAIGVGYGLSKLVGKPPESEP